MKTRYKVTVAIALTLSVYLVAYQPMQKYGRSSITPAIERRWDAAPQIWNSNNMNIKIGIILSDESGYTEFTASVLRKYHEINGYDITVYTSDTVANNHSQIKQWYGSGITITSLPTSFPAKTIFQEFVHRDKHETLFLVDSNMVFLPTWKDFITHHMITSNKTIQFLSLYHSARMHSFTFDCEEIVESDLCEGPVQSKLGIALSKSFVRSILHNHSDLLEQYNWDEILRKQKLPSLYPRKSLLVQIGQTNQTRNYCGKIDVPYSFNSCQLPLWIRDGLEFYMDRCTNPQEKYVPGISIEQARRENRSWTQPAVSYSLFGSKTKYRDGALANCKRVYSIYPGWKVWIYLDNAIPNNVVGQLCEQNVKFVNMTGTDVINKMSWRFLIASEPVPMYAIRDLDSKLITRGKAAVDEWIKSGRKFHVMRDHKYHAVFPMSGGMWGGRVPISDMRNMIKTYNGGNAYLTDMNFLWKVVWQIVKKSVWAHDSHSIHKFGEDHPFATPWNSSNFVGNKDFL